jgi:branched-chain amino acid transport system substrate-binding protein
MNNDFANRSVPIRFNLRTADTRLEVAEAVRQMEEMQSAGVRFIVGPQSSAELAAVKPLADAGGTLVVSHASTAGSLALPGDAVLRFCPGDAVETDAIAATLYAQGIRAIVAVSRDDVGNKGLQSSLVTNFTRRGGEVSSMTPYPTTTTDFESVLADLKSRLTSYKNAYGSSKVAVYLSSFDEGMSIMRSAAADPEFSSVRWVGGDGIVKSSVLISDAVASEFAVATRFFAPEFGLLEADRSKWEPLSVRIRDKCGLVPDAFCIASYDAVRVFGKVVEVGRDVPSPFANLLEGFLSHSNGYVGAGGETMLDINGDRLSGSYDYWSVNRSGTKYSWYMSGRSQ